MLVLFPAGKRNLAAGKRNLGGESWGWKAGMMRAGLLVSSFWTGRAACQQFPEPNGKMATKRNRQTVGNRGNEVLLVSSRFLLVCLSAALFLVCFAGAFLLVSSRFLFVCLSAARVCRVFAGF